MSDVENIELTPMQKLIMQADGDVDLIGEQIAGVLEFLTVRAVMDAPFYIFTEDEEAMVLVAAGEQTQEIVGRLSGMEIKRWEDDLDETPDNVIPFERDVDPGDEQDESATQPE
jgi:hypothetical protein